MADIGVEHVARYRREGAIVVEGLLDDATRRRMKEVLADLVERSRDVREHDDVYDLEPAHSARAPRVRRSGFEALRPGIIVVGTNSRRLKLSIT